MRAIKIDVKNKTIVEVEIDKNYSLAEMQAIVGGLIEVAHEFENLDTLFVNEEALLGRPEGFFILKGASQAFFAGNGVIVGYNPKNGESVSSKSALSEISSKVKFLGLEEVLLKIR